MDLALNNLEGWYAIKPNQSKSYVHFHTNTLRKDRNLLNFPAMG